MKKYTKPMIAFESFSLCTNIAACDNEATFADATCAPFDAELDDFGSYNVFMQTACDLELTLTSGANDSFCYHVPTFSFNIQGS